ncbi:MAG: hypothetical protein LBQ73_05935 [Tannerellaceae bacterium]|jgi:hypothetical protein|nr:hypothetical protein [Tannerellaceae bacterium]
MKGHIFKHVVWGLAMAAALGSVVMLLWNALVPDIFGLATISFWQALGLFILARLLFGHIGRGMMGAGHWHHNPLRDKWMKMTPEQREKFINKRHEVFHKHAFGRHGFGGEKDFDFDTCDESKKGDE